MLVRCNNSSSKLLFFYTLFRCIHKSKTTSGGVFQSFHLFSCLVKHAGDLSQALAQSLPYLLGAGLQLGGLASIKVCGNETVKADLILIERKHSLHHQFS